MTTLASGFPTQASRTLEPSVQIKQYYLSCLAHASYLVVDEKSKVAAVIDPQRDVEQYLETAKEFGAEIKYVILTHFHADFLSGHLELRKRVGAQIVMGQNAQPEYKVLSMKDGQRISLGDVDLEFLETPGHTPESVSIVAYDNAADKGTPHAVFTGDTLFIGDVGRPDLFGSIGVTAQDLAGNLFDSLHNKLMALPDETILYPGHGAGSLCGKNLSSATSCTIGNQRSDNYALQIKSKEQFVADVTSEQPMAPAYFLHDAILNRKEHPTLDETLGSSLNPLSDEDLLRLQKAGALVLDVRDAQVFSENHLLGSLNVGLDGKFATWAGTHVSPHVKVVLIAELGQEKEAALRLGRIGLDNVVGYLEGGIETMTHRTELFSSFVRYDAKQLAAALKTSTPPVVLDVRAPGEFNNGHVAGAINMPLQTLDKRMANIPAGRPLVLICRTGYRSVVACSLMAQYGITGYTDVLGGMHAWVDNGFDTVTPQNA
jgi:hydroxyacylglutathione hydrolase